MLLLCFFMFTPASEIQESGTVLHGECNGDGICGGFLRFSVLFQGQSGLPASRWFSVLQCAAHHPAAPSHLSCTSTASSCLMASFLCEERAVVALCRCFLHAGWSGAGCLPPFSLFSTPTCFSRKLSSFLVFSFVSSHFFLCLFASFLAVFDFFGLVPCSHAHALTHQAIALVTNTVLALVVSLCMSAHVRTRVISTEHTHAHMHTHTHAHAHAHTHTHTHIHMHISPLFSFFKVLGSSPYFLFLHTHVHFSSYFLFLHLRSSFFPVPSLPIQSFLSFFSRFISFYSLALFSFCEFWFLGFFLFVLTSFFFFFSHDFSFCPFFFFLLSFFCLLSFLYSCFFFGAQRF